MKYKSKVDYKVSERVLRDFLEATFGAKRDEANVRRWRLKYKPGNAGEDSYYEVMASRLITKDEKTKLRDDSLPQPVTIPAVVKSWTV